MPDAKLRVGAGDLRREIRRLQTENRVLREFAGGVVHVFQVAIGDGEDLSPEERRAIDALTARAQALGIEIKGFDPECAACGREAEGHFSIHRDGFSEGPEVPLCDACGSELEPTCSEIWERIRARRAEGPHAASKDAMSDDEEAQP